MEAEESSSLLLLKEEEETLEEGLTENTGEGSSFADPSLEVKAEPESFDYAEGTSNNWDENDDAPPRVCNIPDLTPPPTRSASSSSVDSENDFGGPHTSTSSSSSCNFQSSSTRGKKRRKLQYSSERQRFDNILNKVDSILNQPDPLSDPIVRAATHAIAGFMTLLSKKDKKAFYLRIIKVLQEYPIDLDTLDD
ncbi:uncharacterized protein LOC135199274 [Macrobrachium nipponense]|uniref:uncharacterized protein LOC135199274 n=1 Tax=Macrobrachium nipponense TaxID=159736 RepID=UPI0030C7E66B